MNILLCLAFLFAVGSFLGWCIEVIFRRFFSKNNPERKWINPGFCIGPYLPIYGTAVCILFLFAYYGEQLGYGKTLGSQIILFCLMSITITIVEYFAGLVLLKQNIRLWDYRKCWGNINGLICPQFTFFWLLLAAAYYWILYPVCTDWIIWLSKHLAFSFFIGFFFGVFLIDVSYSSNITKTMGNFGKNNNVIIHYDDIKKGLVIQQMENGEKNHFFLPFRSIDNLNKHLKEELKNNTYAMYEKNPKKNK